jgi:CPA1 family monovalent cation:H+ antiporter
VALALSRSGDVESAQTRLVAGTTWEIVELLMTGAAFAFVGVELRTLASSVPGPLGEAIWQALIVTAVVVAVRFLWIFPVTTVDERLRRRGGDTAEPVGWQQMTVASWAGMRGVVTLAAVLALPMGFPERERLIFIAFVVIISTMLVQGLTLPALVKRLDVVASVDERDVAAQDLLRRARDAGHQRLQELRQRGDVASDVLDHAEENAERMWHSMGFEPDEHAEQRRRTADHAITAIAVKEEIWEAAREAVLDTRAESATDPTIVDVVLRRLDARGSQPE